MLWLKSHWTELALLAIALIVSLVLLVFIIKKPERLGLTRPINKLSYLLPFLPIIVFATVILRNKTEGLTYPTAIDMHGNIIFVRGISIFYRERPEDGLEIEEPRDLMLLIDKSKGNEMARFNGATGSIWGNKLFTAGVGGFHIVNLATGNLENILSEDQIKERIGRYSDEKIYSVKNDGGATFHVQTVRDKQFIYNALVDSINVDGGSTLFSGRLQPQPYAGKTNLFQPLVIGESKNGNTLLMSYEDLEKEAFFISSVNSQGEIAWSKRSSELSVKLGGELFADSNCPANTLIDGENLYFVNQHHLVCINATTGELQWIVSI